VSYSLHPEAERDIADATDFYRVSADASVAERFIAEVERVAQLLARHPGLGTPLERGRRAFPLQVFPYVVVYREMQDKVRVLIVRHQHRRPGFGGGRR
jgi:plasmid stabilization system protein ParE